jgi:uncharacterized membrane protein YkvA (DUF1232 family)
VENSKSLITRENQPGFLGELWQQARLIYRLFLDPEVPFYIKLLPVAAAAYLLFPFDFLPDVIPGFGQLDDITILIVGAKMFIELAPQHVVERYLREMQSVGNKSSQAGDQLPDDSYSYDQNIIDGIILEDDSAANESNNL